MGKDVITQSAKKSDDSHKKKKENDAPNSLVFAQHRSTLCALLFVTRLQSSCFFCFTTSGICVVPRSRSLFDYIENKPLLLCSIERRHFSPQKKGEIYLSKMNFLKQERDQDETRVFLCVFRVFFRKEENSLGFFNLSISSKSIEQFIHRETDSSSDTAQHFDLHFLRARILYYLYINDGIRCDDARCCCRDDDENDDAFVFLFDREKNDDPKRDSCENDKESSDGQQQQR